MLGCGQTFVHAVEAYFHFRVGPHALHDLCGLLQRPVWLPLLVDASCGSTLRSRLCVHTRAFVDAIYSTDTGQVHHGCQVGDLQPKVPVFQPVQRFVEVAALRLHGGAKQYSMNGCQITCHLTDRIKR